MSLKSSCSTPLAPEDLWSASWQPCTTLTQSSTDTSVPSGSAAMTHTAA